MHSFVQSFVLCFSLLIFLTYADKISPRHNVSYVSDCPTPERVTVTVTVPASEYSNLLSPNPGQYLGSGPVSSKLYEIPAEYKSCFDRSSHSFVYSYDHGEYHFDTFKNGQKTEEPQTKGSWLDKSTSSAYITQSPSSTTFKASSSGYNSQLTGPALSAKVWSTVHYNKTIVSSDYSTTSKISYSKATSPPSQTASNSSVLPTNSTNSTIPSCQPDLQLDGASEYGFNAKDAAFSVKIGSCSKFGVGNTTAFANFAAIDGITMTSDSISFPGFSDDYVLLSIFALDTLGNAILKSYQLHFGNINMPITVLGPDSQPASGISVYGNATIYPGVGQACTTDALGKCSLINLPPTTIGLVARAGSNSIAVDGLASTTDQVTLKLLPFTQPSGNSTLDANNGTSGWTEGTISQSFKIKRETTFTLSTNGQYDLQSASNSLSVRPSAKTAYIKYKFITSEVPGGYFGTRFNDYYSVTIRSDTGAFVTVTNSMNALGLGAFDADGATDWFMLSLNLPANTKSVEYDIGVSNVADNLLDSSVVIDQVGDLQCDKCGDCTSCPSEPMCQSSCTNPPPKSCAFYRSCAEAQLSCGASGPDSYPLSYGEKNCNAFVNNLKYFSSAGQDWIFGTMHCLQAAMVPVLKSCPKPTCSSFQQAAFDSHPGCYVANGFCGLQCPDVLAVLMTVNKDLLSGTSVQQMIQTGGLCIQNVIQTLSGCGGDVVFAAATGALGGAATTTKIALNVALALFKSVIGEAGL